MKLLRDIGPACSGALLFALWYDLSMPSAAGVLATVGALAMIGTWVAARIHDRFFR